MNITAQVSVYPLGQQNINPPIEQAIEMLRAVGLVVESGAMSTVIAGETDGVFAALRDVFGTLTEQGAVVMTVTFSNACPVPVPHA